MDLKDDCICPQLYDLYQKEFLCDVVLIAKQDGTRIATHRIIISAASEYFQLMFGTSMKEKDMKEIALGNVSGTVLKNLVDYCYTGQYHIDGENFNEVLSATTMFRFEKLVGRCADYMKYNVNIESCLDIWTAAKLFELNEVSSTAWHYICDNFPDVVETDAFLLLSSEQLLEISNSDEIAVETEENLFTSIMKWVEFDAENRRQEFENLISVILMSEISPAFLIEHVLKFLKVIGQSHLFIQLCENAGGTVEVNPRNRRKNIYASCGFFDKQEVKIQRYNKSLNLWEIAYTFNKNLRFFDVICNRNDMFLIGGIEKEVVTNKLWCLSLNALNPELKEIKPMKNKRCSSASAKLFDCLYVTGGYNKNSSHGSQSVERLDLTTMEWTEVSPMKQERIFHTATILSDKLFVTGGFCEKGLNSVEYYDPQSNSWSTVSSMNKPRYGHCCVIVNKVLYAIGGQSGDTFLKSIEKYDFVADKWIIIEMEISNSLRLFGAVVSQNWVFIGGGQSTGSIQSKIFEKLNIETGERLVLSPLINGGDYTKLLG